MGDSNIFDHKQNIEQNYIDERVLPEKGLISLQNISEYYGHTYHSSYIDDLIKEFETNNIPILKISKNKYDWLVRLQDIKVLK